jgi:hypothetical protein
MRKPCARCGVEFVNDDYSYYVEAVAPNGLVHGDCISDEEYAEHVREHNAKYRTSFDVHQTHPRKIEAEVMRELSTQ